MEFESVFALVAPAFARVEPRRRARMFIQALLAPVESRTYWRIAEYAGEADPGGMQRLLASASWMTRGSVRRSAAMWSPGSGRAGGDGVVQPVVGHAPFCSPTARVASMWRAVSSRFIGLSPSAAGPGG
jgi:hypothetical protein